MTLNFHHNFPHLERQLVHDGVGGLDLIDVVLGEVLEDVADVDVLLDGGAVQPHVAPLRQGLHLLAALRRKKV